MTTEVATYIEELDPARPTSTERAGESYEHDNLIKATIKQTFVGEVGTDVYDTELLVGPRAINGFPTRLDDLEAIDAETRLTAIEANYVKTDEVQTIAVAHHFQDGLTIGQQKAISGVRSGGAYPADLLQVINLPVGVDQIQIGQGTQWTEGIYLEAPDDKITARYSSGDATMLHTGNMMELAFKAMFPVGSVFFTTGNTNPGTWMPNSTWTLISSGKFIVGVGTNTDRNGEERTYGAGTDNVYGEYKHQLTAAEMPRHQHPGIPAQAGNSIVGGQDGGRVSGTTSSGFAGTDEPHENTPPAFGLYVWQRTG